MQQQMTRFILSTIFLFACQVLSAQKQLAFYVSNAGKDSYPGTFEKPFATIQRAKAAIKSRKSKDDKTSFVVYIRGGNYFISSGIIFDSVDGGTKENPVTYTAYKDEAVHFSGGVSIPVNKAVPVTDPAILKRIESSAQHKILQVNLKALGITNYGTLYPKGFGRPYTVSPMELFCNNNAMKLARWPNDSLVPMGKVLDAGSIPRNGDTSQKGGVFKYKSDRPSRWTNAKDIWISGLFKYGYADDAVAIAKLDTTNKTFTTVQPTTYGFESGKIFQRWYAFNLLEEIDEPGEYYIDKRSGILYFYPPEKDLKSIELSLTESPLLILSNASFITFSKITFECTRGMAVYMEKGTNDAMDSCVFRNIGMMAVSMGKGVELANSFDKTAIAKPKPAMVGNLYGYMYNNTVFNREAGSNCIISNCTIYNTGSGGIILSGGNRLTLEKGNNVVYNCSIHDFNRLDRSYKAGINIDGVGNIIRNCEIYNCPGSAILMHGNDHLIELNNIHDAVIDGDDMGAIYYGRDPSELGNKIRNNFFHHIGNAHGVIMAVYHDDGACGAEVTGNVFYKAGSRTVMIGGGNDNKYYNNIFIDCPMAFHLDNRLMGWSKNLIEPKGLFEQRLQAVNYPQPPYSQAYPLLSNYFNDNVGFPKRNYIERNVFVNVKFIHNGKPEWSYIGRNLTLSDKDIFVDFDHMDFQLKKSSEVYKLMPDFKEIPFNKIGLVKNYAK
jgi:hypothetical protein